MKTRSILEPNIDRFEGEGGALAGHAATMQQTHVPEMRGPPTAPGRPGNWRVRASFLAELDDLLEARDLADIESRRRRNATSDRNEEFSQRFQELVQTQILPQFESVAALLSKRFYPVEVRVAGAPEERVCFLAFSPNKRSGNWALKGGQIDGPRMVFRSDTEAQKVIYSVTGGKETSVERKLGIQEITDTFLEQELHNLLLSVSGKDQTSAGQIFV